MDLHQCWRPAWGDEGGGRSGSGVMWGGWPPPICAGPVAGAGLWRCGRAYAGRAGLVGRLKLRWLGGGGRRWLRAWVVAGAVGGRCGGSGRRWMAVASRAGELAPGPLLPFISPRRLGVSRGLRLQRAILLLWRHCRMGGEPLEPIHFFCSASPPPRPTAPRSALCGWACRLTVQLANTFAHIAPHPPRL